jgi:hypothetical protein
MLVPSPRRRGQQIRGQASRSSKANLLEAAASIVASVHTVWDRLVTTDPRTYVNGGSKPGRRGGVKTGHWIVT